MPGGAYAGNRGRRWWQRRPRGRWLRTGGCDRGAAPLELAILWPLILLLIFGAVQVATYFTARSVALSAAQVAAGTARQYNATDDEGVARAEAFLTQTRDWLVDWEVHEPVRDEEAGQVSVTVTGEALSLVPFYTWEIQQTARGEIERFTTP